MIVLLFMVRFMAPDWFWVSFGSSAAAMMIGRMHMVGFKKPIWGIMFISCDEMAPQGQFTDVDCHRFS
jgi:hypothetical protein